MFPGGSPDEGLFSIWWFFFLLAYVFLTPVIAAVITGTIAGWWTRGLLWWWGTLAAIPGAIAAVAMAILVPWAYTRLYNPYAKDEHLIPLHLAGIALTCVALALILVMVGRSRARGQR